MENSDVRGRASERASFPGVDDDGYDGNDGNDGNDGYVPPQFYP